ncbi:MAG TPA: M3 family metallopeptidase [Polyangiaceae bacterium]
MYDHQEIAEITRGNKARQGDIAARLSELASTFASNVAAATADFSKPIEHEAELAGMSAQAKQRAQRKAEEQGLQGFLLTLDSPSYHRAIASLDDRVLRKSLYEAYYTRASDRGPRAGRFDNTPVLNEVLELRLELALSRGFKNYAELALHDGIVTDPDEVERRLLWEHRGTRQRAQAELDLLWAFAKKKGVPRGFSVWDLPYYAAWLIREELGVDEELLNAHFGFADALKGALTVASERLGLHVMALAPESSAERGRAAYRVANVGGRIWGVLDFDAFGSPVSSENGVFDLDAPDDGVPVVRVQCGIEAPLPGEPIQLKHTDIRTLFRRTGHALFLLLTRTGSHSAKASPSATLGGEVAGRFFERFASHFDTLQSFARHRETGHPLGHAQFEQLVRRNNVHRELDASQALELFLFDLRVHRDHAPRGKSTQLRAQVLDTFTQIRREQSVLPPSYWTRFANICAPIFAGDRAARLWQDDWAERMGSALYAALESSGFSNQVTRQQRDSFWAVGDLGIRTRIERALGQLPAFGPAT